MPPSCPMTSGGFRGPPVPLLVVPVVIQLVRLSRDPKMTTYLSHISKGGPMAIAENAHKLAQYALSKVPSDVLYWLTSKVLNLPPGTAMQTTEFLKSRSDLEILMGEDPSICHDEQGSRTAALIPSDIERRLEKLELEYQVLQEKHNRSLQLLTYQADDPEIPRELSLPDSLLHHQIKASTDADSMQLMQLEPSPSSHHVLQNHEVDANTTFSRGVGLRLGQIFLQWAGDTMKQSLVAAASKSSANSAVVGAGVDLASRLVDAVVT